jgi:hypothetical protein
MSFGCSARFGESQTAAGEDARVTCYGSSPGRRTWRASGRRLAYALLFPFVIRLSALRSLCCQFNSGQNLFRILQLDQLRNNCVFGSKTFDFYRQEILLMLEAPIRQLHYKMADNFSIRTLPQALHG